MAIFCERVYLNKAGKRDRAVSQNAGGLLDSRPGKQALSGFVQQNIFEKSNTLAAHFFVLGNSLGRKQSSLTSPQTLEPLP